MNKLNNEANKKENTFWPIDNKRLLEAKGQILSSVKQPSLSDLSKATEIYSSCTRRQETEKPSYRNGIGGSLCEKLPLTSRLRCRGDCEGLVLRGSSREVS